MNPESTKSDDDLRRIIEVLQTQVSTMQTELDDMKTKMDKVEEDTGVLISEPVPEPETREDVIEYMKKIPGIGINKASLLYYEGFDSTEKLKNATADEFVQVRGIGRSMANKMVESIEAIEKVEDLAAKEEPGPAATEPPKPEGGGAMGFFKNTYNKVLGFFKGKKPAPAEEEQPQPEGESEDKKTDDEPKEEPAEPGEEEKDTPAEEPKEEGKEDTGEEPAAGDVKSVEEPSEASRDTETVGGVEITAEEPRELTKDDIIASYGKLEGVSEDIAKALYKAGYESMDELKEAQVEDLQMVPGIDSEAAETIVNALKEV